MSTDYRGEQAYRAAVIGCGRMGTYTRPELAARLPHCWLPLNHAEAILALGNVELTAFCDVNEDAATQAATRFGVKNTYTDYRALIEQEHPDIVTIATRTAGRVGIIEFAATHGVKRIHAEKPLCRNLAEAERIAQAIRRYGVDFTYGTIRRYFGIYRKAKEIAHSGELGDLRQIIVNMGRTYLLWSHPHSVDMMLFLAGCGEVSHVSANLTITEGATADETMIDDDPIVESAVIQLANGVQGVITGVGGLDTILACERGNIIVGADGATLTIERPTCRSGGYFLDRVTATYPSSDPEGTVAALRDLLAGKNQDVLADAIAGMRALLAMGLSQLRGGRRIKFNEVDEDFTITGRMGALFA